VSEIKSALELALERTADVQGDKSKIESHEARQFGMKLAGRVMEDPSIKAKKEISALARERQKPAREGFVSVLMSQLALPTQESDLERLHAAKAGFGAVVRDEKLLATLMDQVEQLLHQYLDQKNQLIEALREQFAPRLRQQEEEIARQTGQRVKLDPAASPEFAKALNENLRRLQGQYKQVINQAREQLQNLL
jgi:hypothetical protein